MPSYRAVLSDDPFVNTPDALPEIYSYGHRQPQGLVKHPQKNEIWENEHGEMGGCELNLLRSGKNYGWPEVTFSHNYNGSIISEDTVRAGMEPPVHYWSPSLAPLGMDFVYADRYYGWEGNLFIGSPVQKMLNRSEIKNNLIIRNEKLLQNI